MNTITRRIATWIACFAILFAALAPSVSHAWSVSQGTGWAEICRAGGSELVKLSVDSAAIADPAMPDSAHLKHCPFCATHGASFALPPTAGFSIPAIAMRDTHPVLFFQSPRPLAIWTVAQSRAPPASL